VCYIAEEEITALLKKLVSDKKVETVYDIDLRAMYDSGIGGIVADLDKTLVGAKDPYATPVLITWFKKVKSLGIQVVVVSNNSRLRVAAFAFHT
jgi:predicted HAD superfamily phosphohydrolase YqeG